MAGRAGRAGGATGGEAGRAGAGGASGGFGAASGSGATSQAGAGEGGSSDGGSGGEAPRCGVGDPAQACLQTPDPYVATIVDFSRYASDGTWTSATVGGIGGKTTRYHSAGAHDLTLKLENALLHVTGTIPPQESAGWIFSLDRCGNGAHNLGITMGVLGSFEGTTFTLALQTNADYPIDVRTARGACAFTSCSTIETECRAPHLTIAADDVMFDTFYGYWDSFKEGVPVVHAAPDALWGIEFEFKCEASTECAVDLTFSSVKYFQA